MATKKAENNSWPQNLAPIFLVTNKRRRAQQTQHGKTIDDRAAKRTTHSDPAVFFLDLLDELEGGLALLAKLEPLAEALLPLQMGVDVC